MTTSRRRVLSGMHEERSESDLVLCIVRANSILDVPVPKVDWLIFLDSRSADVFVQDAGN
ncbi:MAG: hypothetical protein OJF50_004078 [Nitrospira sp.]|jgi:hypothetical protein|nr:hypothetical protein [Nitrospira sp.]